MTEEAPVPVEVNGSITTKDERPAKESPARAFFGKLAANAEMCEACNKRVYATERIGTGQTVYHKACFRCTHCKKTLTIGQYTVADGMLFCKPHYLQEFKGRGGKYKYSDSKTGGISTSSTPIAVRQSRPPELVRADRAGASYVRSPVITSGGTSPGLLSPRSSMLSPDSDSVGNVKKMPTFAATRALFENASFSGGGRTPTEKPVTPSRHVKDMIATYRPPVAEVSSPPPVTPTKDSDLLSLRYSDRAAEQEKQKTEDEEQLQARREEAEEQKEKEKERVENLIDVDHDHYVNKQEEETVQNLIDIDDVHVQKQEEEQPNLIEIDEDHVDNRREDELDEEQRPTASYIDDHAAGRATVVLGNDDANKKGHVAVKQETEEEEDEEERDQDSDHDYVELVDDEDEQDQEERLPPATTRYDDDDDDDDDDDNDAVTEKNNNDNGDEGKYSDKENDDNDVIHQQQQQQHQTGDYF